MDVEQHRQEDDVMHLTSNSVRRVVPAVLTMLLISALAVLGPSQSAQAWTFTGCKYAGSSPPIRYRFLNANLTWNDRYHEARDNWNATPVPGTFVFDNSNPDPQIDITSNSYAWSEWAITSWSCSGGTYVDDEVLIRNNMTTISGLTSQNLRRIAIHELGHSYGLDHVLPATCNADGSANPRAVMSQGATKFGCASAPPWQDDQNGVTARY